MSDTVWIAAGARRSNRIYHTDRDCRHLSHVDNVRETTLEAVGHAYDECRTCQGEGGAGNGGGVPDRTYYEAALAAGRDD